VLRRLLTRLRREEGFGLIELTIAITVLAVGILALVGSFSSGYLAVKRAGMKGTAAVLADRTMEAYRGATYSAISAGSPMTYSSSTSPASPDGRTYIVTTTVTPQAATNSSGSVSNTGLGVTGTSDRTVKVVVVTVTDSSGRTWASETSTFDPLTGCATPTTC
jgi:type II secretory pathway pseudopilin PulG